jgi:RNA polymerase sigma-70 factor (ECF subfamily)
LDAADDPTLVTALLAQDSKAPLVLWRRFSPLVFRILRRMLGESAEVEDLAQEVFLCVYRKASELRNRRALPAFIASATRLTAHEEIRRSRQRRMKIPASVPPPSVDLHRLSTVADAREALVRFHAILGRLTATDRTAFVLRFIDGVPLADVANALGVSLSTIKRRLARVWSRVGLFVERDALLSQYRGRKPPGASAQRTKGASAFTEAVTLGGSLSGGAGKQIVRRAG